MNEPLKRLLEIYQLPANNGNITLLQNKEYRITEGIQYSYHQYDKPIQWTIDNKAVVHYIKNQSAPTESKLQLVYYLLNQPRIGKPAFQLKESQTETIEIIHIEFSPAYLARYQNNVDQENTYDKILSFQEEKSFTKQIELCNKTLGIIYTLKDNHYIQRLEQLFMHAQIQMLLLYSMDCMLEEREVPFTCRFLANEMDQEKILKAKELLIQRIGNPITIKELSKKVAMNECYLKKGFKEMIGCTIFEFYQNKRMEYARSMLCEKGLSVTDVSNLLGYSSISHFSTAFKKHSGIKPCELLFK